ncbi:hypothetical protein ACFV2X_41805 [Streptomyces sp. NPDC059679]|uniref:hypothetical protein n=1 Tax=Streptomyces sp. NPDC059679 TaxID=3346903 RepID=UPI003686C71E
MTVTAIRPAGPAAPFARQPAPAWPSDLPLPAETEKRALLWCKATDPNWRPCEQALATAEDIRVIVPTSPDFDPLRTFLAEHGVPVRSADHWVESEQVSTVGDLGVARIWRPSPPSPAVSPTPRQSARPHTGLEMPSPRSGMRLRTCPRTRRQPTSR